MERDIIADFAIERIDRHRGHGIVVSLERHWWTVNVFDCESRAPAYLLALTSEHSRRRFRDRAHACEWAREWVDGLLAEVAA